ncbi:OprD family porin [Pseudomonas sp. B21-035]|uniref:OprD family porin n=1 Tax=Pseudomonas sp. B21-035 TaxID=2895484 RepID=UPI00215F9109|nr:OprD family porin [Pseudomonas sp. B21-035]UVL55298.1 OprD family porin [Pseudomonas sp. B21-035]
MGNKSTACFTGALALASCATANAVSQPAGGGFVEDSSLTVLSRNFYFNRDYRNGEQSPTGKAGYAEAWAQAFIARFESGYTEGTVGFGLDAHAMLALKLDSGDGRSGGRSSFDMLPVDRNGDIASNFSKLGGAIKARLFDTELKFGDVFPTTPVVHFGDSRLLPESFTGWTLENTSLAGLKVQGGRLHAMSQPLSSNNRDGFVTFYAGPVDSPWLGYFGGDYQATDNLSLSLYSSRLKDAWDQYYAGVSYKYPITRDLTGFTSFNYYKAKDEGQQLLGTFDNDIWSARVGVSYGAHTLALSHQRNQGDNDFDYLRQSDSIYLDNSIQYSDFNSPKERSWMLRYDLDMAAYGVPGLSFMSRYGRGSGIDYSDANGVYMRRDAEGNPLTGQKRWERDIEAKYVVQSGSLKDLSLRVRQATTRATAFESDLDEVRLIVEYPLSVL